MRSRLAFNTRTRVIVRKFPRGFMRVWLVLSMCWLFGVIVDFGAAFAHVSLYANPIESFGSPMDGLPIIRLAVVAASPPLVLILIGWGLGD